MMSGMEMYQLRSFVMVAEIGNLTQAADRLFTSQPAVSAHIKALEEEFKIQLFKRSAKGMQLTQSGLILRDKAQQLLEMGQELQNKAKSLQQEIHGSARIGLNSDTDYLRLTDWHKTLIEQYPNLTIELVQDTSVQLLNDVRAGFLDASFYSGHVTVEGLDYMDLMESKAVIAAAKSWRKKVVGASIEELAKLPWIQPEPLCIYHKFINELFQDNKRKPKKIITSATEESTLKLLLAGVGLSIIRDDEANRQSVNGNIIIWPDRCFSLPLRLAYLRKRREDPLIKALSSNILHQFELMKSA